MPHGFHLILWNLKYYHAQLFEIKKPYWKQQNPMWITCITFLKKNCFSLVILKFSLDWSKETIMNLGHHTLFYCTINKNVLFWIVKMLTNFCCFQYFFISKINIQLPIVLLFPFRASLERLLSATPPPALLSPLWNQCLISYRTDISVVMVLVWFGLSFQWVHLTTCLQREYMKTDTTSSLTSGLLAVCSMR